MNKEDENAMSAAFRAGFTLIEIIVAVAIIGILGAVAVVGVVGQLEKAKETAARDAVQNLKNGVVTYQINYRKYPNSLNDLVEPKGDDEPIMDGGAGALKRYVTDAVNDYFAPIRARREELSKDPTYIHDVLAEGNARANEIANETLDEVRRAMGMVY
jgi:prepilin-type N-terminal cleavage/methylation domain-containing protein